MNLPKTYVYLERRRINTWVSRAALGLAMFVAVAMDLERTSRVSQFPSQPLILMLVASIGAAIIARLMRFSVFPVKETLGKGSIDDEAVCFEKRGESGSMELAEIEEILCPRGSYLGLRNSEGEILHLLSSKSLSALVSALEARGCRRVVRLTLGEPKFTYAIGALLGVFGAFGAAFLTSTVPSATLNLGAFLLGWYAVYLACWALLGPDTLVLGIDGITLEKPFSRRFIPFSDLERVETARGHVALHRKRGQTLRAKAWHLADDQISLLDNLVAKSKKPRETPKLELAELDRAGRPIAAWRAALATLLAPERDYRRVPVEPEALAEVLVNPEMTAERRLGAAIALAADSPPGLRQPIRLAALATANEPMRRALKALCYGRTPDAILEKALNANTQASQ